ncbi:hypothetical protein [Ectopseudomonas oleovorans]|uniref:Uncharacterized protein n=1 Tax=Ectopseudomonas oleovorans TaxID=301 RepID=A0AA42QFY7_ECTOL|nr:hypothetical protein [Pseudomonas oleovorans]MDH1341879.1 hypothetical protein [Pseudomonas oleovorans]MDH1490875.1 hypothetical protein [Pseudomonas oleovorans]WGG19622.1 hypothetical protein N5O83_14185 [Pseudomonas oleovorans]
MYLHPELINSANPLPYPGLPEREAIRKRALGIMQRQVLNELQQGEPKLCNAFAQFCADRFDEDTRYALCLSRITGEKAAQKLADSWVTEHVEKCRPLFVAEEVERRIIGAKYEALGLPQ